LAQHQFVIVAFLAAPGISPDGRSVHFDTLGRHDYTLYPDGRILSFTYNTDGTTATMSMTAPGESTPVMCKNSDHRFIR
jgi:hypothetical protein